MRLLSIAFLSAIAAAGIANAQQLPTIGGANALSPPAARHLVRIDPGGGYPATYLLALQRGGVDSVNPGLSFYRSTDDGTNWSFHGAINPSTVERDTVDLVKVGNDVAIVYSYDGPSIAPNIDLDPLHKVYFQWWTYNGAGSWTGQTPVLVFTPAAGTAYHRAELAIDSVGRIWVQSWLRSGPPCTSTACSNCNSTNGDNYSNTLVIAVSTNNGATFQQQPSPVPPTICRAGGRLSSLGSKLLMLWNDYSANGGGVIRTRFITRNDADQNLSSWAPAADAFADDQFDGIFHGAALSAVADGAGGLHLLYKDHNQVQLWYRYFSGSTFGAKQLVDSTMDWALQPATTLIGGDLYLFTNTKVGVNNYEMRFRRKLAGWSLFKVADNQVAFKGYPTSPETLPSTVLRVPSIFGQTADENSSGNARVTFSPNFSLSANPTKITVNPGASGTSSVAVSASNGFNSSVTLSATGVPAGASMSFSPNPVSPGASSTATFNSGTASEGSYNVTVNGGGDDLSRSTPLECVIGTGPCAPLTSCSGQCVNLTNDVNNCGACGNACSGVPNGYPGCSNSTCTVGCNPGYHLCLDPTRCISNSQQCP